MPQPFTFAELLALPYAHGPLDLAERCIVPQDGAARGEAMRMHRGRALEWSAQALGYIRDAAENPPAAFVQVMLDIANGRVGEWMYAETRNNAWSAFDHWRLTDSQSVSIETYRALGIVWALGSFAYRPGPL